MQNLAILLTAPKFQEVLDPWSYRAVHTSERWQQCRVAAAVALKGLLNMSWDEICSLRRVDCMPDGEPVIRIRDTVERLDRELPLIDAAKVVLERYLEEMPFKESRYVFVAKSGKRILQQTFGMAVKKAGQRIGIADLTGSLRATFYHAVMADPIRDGTAEFLLQIGSRDAPRPTLERMKECIERHPTAPFARIAFYDRKTPHSELRAKILAYDTVRELSYEEQLALQTKYFPQAFELWSAKALNSTEIGRFFGFTSEEAYNRLYAYRQKGRVAIQSRFTGRFTHEWRTRVLSEYARLSPVPSFTEFHQHLVDTLDFPYDRTTLGKFLKEVGEEAPVPQIMTKAWCELVEREYETGGKMMASWRAFYTHLKTEHQFPYVIDTILKLARRKGLARPRPEQNQEWWAQRLADEALRRRPTSWVAFHADMIRDMGFPRGVMQMTNYLLSRRIVICVNDRTRSQRSGYILAETGLPLP